MGPRCPWPRCRGAAPGNFWPMWVRSTGIYAPDFAAAAPKCDSQVGVFCGVHTHISVVAWSYIGGSIWPSTTCTETQHEVQAVWGCCIWAGEAPQVLPRAARRRNLGFIAPYVRQPLGAQCSEPPRESRWPRDPAQVEPRWPVCPGGRDGIPLPTPHAAPRGARVNEVLEHSRSIFSFQSTR